MNVTHRDGKIYLYWDMEVVGTETGKGSTAGGRRQIELTVPQAESLLSNGRLRGAIEDARLFHHLEAERAKKAILEQAKRLRFGQPTETF